MEPPLPKLRIGVVGGGIGGLTLAVALSHLGLDTTLDINIYEAAEKLTQVGAGITLWPRGWEILHSLNLDRDLAKHLPPGQIIPSNDSPLRLAWAFRKSDEENGSEEFRLMIRGGSTSFHRADVQDVLLKHISPNIKFHLSHRLSSYDEQGNVINLHFTNGTSVQCDMLIGADGVKSPVRQSFIKLNNMLPPKSRLEPLFTGTFVYRGLVDSDIVRKTHPNHPAMFHAVVYCGKSKHIVAYPVLQGKQVNIVAFVSDMSLEDTVLEGPAILDSTLEELVAHYAGWEDDACCLIGHMDNPAKWAIQSVNLERYALGRVAILGDAAHAMTLNLGNGAGQAIEDAFMLAQLLSKAVGPDSRRNVDIAQICEVYNTVRQPIAHHVQSTARDLGVLYEFNAPGFEDIQAGDSISKELFANMFNKIEDAWRWVWTTSSQTDLEKAMALMAVGNLN